MSKTALITGGSGGIGKALAHQCAAHGYDLILVARNEEKLQATKDEFEQLGISVDYLVSDLSDPASPKQIMEFVGNRRIDVLINNAGFGLTGMFVDTNLDVELDMIQVNISALTALTKLVLPEMIARGEGKILNVASTAAFQPGPTMAVYFATKAYVLHFSEAVRNELTGTGVSVTALCPGPTKTNFEKRAGDPHLFTNAAIMSAERVARVGFTAMMNSKSSVIPGLRNNVLTFLNRFVPRDVLVKIVRKLMS